MFKHFLFLIIITSLFSCKKEVNSVEVILLNNLKESCSLYKQMCEITTVKIEERSINYEGESLPKDEEFEILKQINSDLDKLFIELKNKSKAEIIKSQESTCSKINAFNCKFKITPIDKSKFENLNDSVAYYYTKTEFYKNQAANLDAKYNSFWIACGLKSLTKEQGELIDKIEKSTVEEFRKEFCNCN